MNFVIVSEKKWSKKLMESLPSSVSGDFVLIDNREDFNPDYLTDINPRYVFIPHWSYIIPAEIFEKFECIVFHMTYLPFGRGGSPLQNLIEEFFLTYCWSQFHCLLYHYLSKFSLAQPWISS